MVPRETMQRYRGRTPTLVLLCAALLAPGAGAQEVAAPMIEIVPPLEVTGRQQRLVALVTSDSIARVDFLVDGRLVSSDRRFPFTAQLKTSHLIAGAEVEVVAIAEDGSELSRDRLLIDAERFPTRVDIAEIRELGDAGWIEVVAQVEHPRAASVERVDFYLGDRFAASTRKSPFRARIPRLQDESFVRAVAHLPDGTFTEAVRVLRTSPATDETTVRMLEVYAMVSDRRGRPVTDLASGDFQLLDGDRRLLPDRFSIGDDVPLTVGLVIDSSGSMSTAMEETKAAARLFLDQALDERDQAFLVDFDARPRLLQPHTDDTELLVSRFDEVSSHGASAVYDAILFSLLNLEGVPGRKALIVLSDGRDSSSSVTIEDCALLARRTGVPVFVIALGERLEHRPSHQTFAMRRLAERSGGLVYEVSSRSQVPEIYRRIDLQLRGQYLLGFSTEGALTTAEIESLRLSVTPDRLRVRTILSGQIQVIH